MGVLERRSAQPNAYSRSDTTWHIKSLAADRTILVSPAELLVKIGAIGAGRGYELTSAQEYDLNIAATWDTQTPTDYTVAANRAGKDFYIYACVPVSGTAPKILISDASTWPSGYDANNSRKIGGFHCLPYVTAPTWAADTVTTVNYVVQPVTPGATKLLYRCTSRAGDFKTDAATEPTWPTTPGETVVDDQVTWTCDLNGCENLVQGTDPYYGFLMGDIIFNSIWDLLDRPKSTPEGMVKLSLTPSDGIPALRSDIYMANGVGATITSVFGATIKVSVPYETLTTYGHLQGKRMLFDSEFLKAATGSPVGTCVAGAVNPTISNFPLDSTGKSIISHYGVIGATGTLEQYLEDNMSEFGTAAVHTHQVVVSGDPQTVTSGNASANVAPANAWQASLGRGQIYSQGIAAIQKMLGGGIPTFAAYCGPAYRRPGSRGTAAVYQTTRFCSEPV